MLSIMTGHEASRAQQILTNKVAKGRAAAKGIVERIFNEVPQDAIVRAQSLQFHADSSLTMARGKGKLRLHPHALRQVASRIDAPAPYIGELAATDEQGGADWKRELAAEVLNRHHQHLSPETRYLVRVVDGEARGVLSDKFRRRDSRPLLEAFTQECMALGAEPIDGMISDVRVALKAALPVVFEPVPGEALVYGVEWANSDFGAGRHTIRGFLMRVWCLNGATLEDGLAQVHLGARIEESFELSQQTYELDTRASVSALRDVVRATLDQKKLDRWNTLLLNAHEKKEDWTSIRRGLGTRLTKAELIAAQEAFEGPDVQNLPEGHTRWRASNALSWIANSTEDMDRRLVLERLAGELVTGVKDVESVTSAL